MPIAAEVTTRNFNETFNHGKDQKRFVTLQHLEKLFQHG